MISNVAGNPKKPVKPDVLYRPNLTNKREHIRTPEEERVWKERTMLEYEQLMNPQE